jgi:2-oxo-4-hydroxy-4-carboxy-5-ureidoimidazoline decarboxylase
MTLDALNAMDQPTFTAAVGWVFEHSSWVAERAWPSRPFADIAALHREMVRQVDVASPEEQLALLRAHPDLGTRAELTRASASEQAAFDFDQRFIELNKSYRDKFGFPFLYAVKGSTKHDILHALELRLPSDRDAEFAEALQQVYKIAAFRLQEIF